MNLNDFFNGTAFDAYNYFGAHKENDGIVFRTYAPNAKKVTVIGEFNNWKDEDMHLEDDIWVLHSDKAKVGQLYKYCIYTKKGYKVEHCDPYGFGMELRPNFSSYIVDISTYKFNDDNWMNSRNKNYNNPMNIYEMHLGSWKTNANNENGWFHYNEIADELIAYIKKHSYTHVEFLPLSEHPADCSWGYQSTGFFAPTSRYGSAAELMELVDKLHKNNIGVIMDFVPVHFAIDYYGLAEYDGTALYEFPADDIAYSEWGTKNFIHSRREVCCFLQSAANYWLTEYHFDGIRMDAISRAIYWQGDPNRGVNPCAVDFIRNMNKGLHILHPTAMLIAEDSTSFLKVTAPVEYDGLGFDYKWDLGWMNDTLDYFRTPPEERPNHYHKLTFSMAYFFNELFILPFSHDENVHGKATIVQKMWGLYGDKFKQCRALYMYMYTHPGKILNFMGNEIAQFREWDETREQDWDMLTYPMHDSFNKYIQKLGSICAKYPALYANDYNPQNFKWLKVNAVEECVYIYERIGETETIICVFNFSNQRHEKFRFKVDGKSKLTEILNSDWQEFSGETPHKNPVVKISRTIMGNEWISLDLAPFSGRIFKAVPYETKKRTTKN